MAGRRREQAGGDAIAIAAVCARGFYRGEREEPPSDKVNKCAVGSSGFLFPFSFLFFAKWVLGFSAPFQPVLALPLEISLNKMLRAGC